MPDPMDNAIRFLMAISFVAYNIRRLALKPMWSYPRESFFF
jgi:hypothetical protein